MSQIIVIFINLSRRKLGTPIGRQHDGPFQPLTHVLSQQNERIRISGFGSLGIGTAAPRCTLDLAEGAVTGINTFMILPKVSSVVGLGTTAGAMMFNTATSKFQGFTGAAWVDLH